MTYEDVKSVVALSAILAAFGVFGFYLYRLLWVRLRRGRSSGPFRDWAERTKGVVAFVGGQRRLFRFPAPGVAHCLLFWGFLFLFLTIVQALFEGLLAFNDPEFVIPGIGEFGPLALAQDIAAVLVLGAVLYALYLRVIVKPERYEGSHQSQGVMVLLFILVIVVSLLIMNGIRIERGVDDLELWRPISALFGGLFGGLAEGTLEAVEETAYWIHLGVVLLFLVELPMGKHFHVVTSIPAVFLRNLEPPGRLPAVADNGDLGVEKIEQFRWRQMLDFLTCTECGRCQDVCPAYAEGLPLSPKRLIMDLRDTLKADFDGPAESPNGLVSDEVLWACTTCYACDQECPLFVEHVTPIVDMRRHLVMEGRMDDMLQEAMANLGRYGNSFGQSDRARAKWTRGVEAGVKDARKEAVEYLWFVGDYASFNTTLTPVVHQTAEVFHRAGLNFGVMYDGERNAGNDVRRAGEEGLFELLVEQNVKSLSRSDYKAIVTTDPHTYSVLKNEYPPGVNGDRPVLHYTELLDQLITAGDLVFENRLGRTVTYHDPCYLGRYNGVYEAPRRVIAATGCRIVEMPRTGDRALCCGAGGGRIWMAEGEVEKRPAEMRVDEAARLDGVDILVVTCPKDYVMYSDALKTAGLEDRLVVKDLIELVHEAL
ncbi:(Fe-S)-binding protein [bacterium]|nr:(Fe-S)-binding protein [bacterium]